MDPSSHLKKWERDTGKKKKQGTEYIIQQNQRYKYQKDYPAYKPTSELNKWPYTKQ
jgi:hypothetical protein